MYPHAGLLSTFHYLRRYPSTETNRNRLRARMVYQHFLGIDVMSLAPRSSDASAIAEQFEVPTMQAADCVVCHRTIDPLAGLFQDYDFEGHIGPRKDGWYTDMFTAGFEGESLPADQRWRAPQWLGTHRPRSTLCHRDGGTCLCILFGRKVCFRLKTLMIRTSLSAAWLIANNAASLKRWPSNLRLQTSI